MQTPNNVRELERRFTNVCVLLSLIYAAIKRRKTESISAIHIRQFDQYRNH